MTRGNSLHLLLCAVLVASLAGSAASTPDTQKDAVSPVVVVLADDTETRGDWLGVYGSYAYVLCGMRSPLSLYGGPGWPIPSFAVATGDPGETSRAWLSSAPAKQDRTVLWEPNGLRRTPAGWDDFGESRPLGKGPDLHLTLSVPKGASLLSLYFFEIDWIQYRAFQIKVYDTARPAVPLAQTSVDNFFKGKYKRFAVAGPGVIRVVIERCFSPNAQLSAVFLDPLVPPSLRLFDLGDDRPAQADDAAVKPLDGASAEAATCLSRLIKTPHDLLSQRRYLDSERTFVSTLNRITTNAPADYCRTLERTWSDMAARAAGAQRVLPPASSSWIEAALLEYQALRAACRSPEAQRQASEFATTLLKTGRDSPVLPRREIDLLRTVAMALAENGRRPEAVAVLGAYVDLLLAREDESAAKSGLLLVARRALRANVARPVARGLEEWQKRYGELAQDDRLLLGSLHYVSGDSAKALTQFKSVEPKMEGGSKHRWLLVAMVTASLREDRLDEARAIESQLRADYPDAPELDEARYRFGVYFYDKRNFESAKKCFDQIRTESKSENYRKLASEYWDRTDQLESIKRAQGRIK